MATNILTQIGTLVGDRLSTIQAGLNSDIALRATKVELTSAVDTLLGGVGENGNTLKKLYDLAVSAVDKVTVADHAARQAYVLPNNSSMMFFVTDDGDGKWAMYYDAVDGVGARTSVKMSDPDMLNLVMTAAQIKAAYESNDDTNAFSDALKTKLEALPDNASLQATLGDLASLTTTAKSSLVAAINELVAGLAAEVTNRNQAIAAAIAQEVTDRTAAIAAVKGDATAAGDTLGKLEDRIETLSSDLSGLSQDQIVSTGALITAKVVDEDENFNAAFVVTDNNTLTDLLKVSADGAVVAGAFKVDDVDAYVNNQKLATETVVDSKISTATTALKGTATAAADTLGKLEGLISTEVTDRTAAITAAVTALKDGVPDAGNTLAKLYNLAVTAVDKVAVADLTARDAVEIANGTWKFIHVGNDGDGKWALYAGFADAEGAKTYEKLSDPDLLNAVMSDAAIKAALLNNADTNVLTDAEYGKLVALPTAAEIQSDIDGLDADIGALSGEVGSLANLTTTEKGTVVGAINEVKAAVGQEATDRTTAITSAVSTLKGDADTSNDTLGKLADRIDGVAADLSGLSQDQIVSTNGLLVARVVEDGTADHLPAFAVVDTNSFTDLFRVSQKVGAPDGSAYVEVTTTGLYIDTHPVATARVVDNKISTATTALVDGADASNNTLAKLAARIDNVGTYDDFLTAFNAAMA